MSDDKGDHTWNLILPICNVSGELHISGYYQEKIEFSGTGYHDHNTGSEPMKNSFEEWYWGRYHTRGAALIYYLMHENGAWQKRAWLIEKGGKTTTLSDRIEPGLREWTPFGLKTARKIEFAGEGIEAVLQKKQVTDEGPFYRRFEGEMMIKKSDKLEKALGISEYIRPSRIYNRLFWPLVNMRIKYPGKAHWVQKSPRLYRWTW
jgi:carotenoid 1,2-hydratase